MLLLHAFKIWIILIFIITTVESFCASNIRWAHGVAVDDLYGMWYGVGYTKHYTTVGRLREIGCVILYITDERGEVPDRRSGPPIPTRQVTDLGYYMYGIGDINAQKRIRVLWDEDGETMELTYLYSPLDPGIWTYERSFLQESFSKTMWYQNQPPRNPEIIRILLSTPDTLIINHCSDQEGIYTLVFRRSAMAMRRSEFEDLKDQFFSLHLPQTYRYEALCSGFIQISSLALILICLSIAML